MANLPCRDQVSLPAGQVDGSRPRNARIRTWAQHSETRKWTAEKNAAYRGLLDQNEERTRRSDRTPTFPVGCQATGLYRKLRNRPMAISSGCQRATRRAPFGQGERPARRQPGEVGPILRSGWSRQGSSPPALGLRVAAPRHLDLEREPGEGRYPDRQRPELEVLLQECVGMQRCGHRAGRSVAADRFAARAGFSSRWTDPCWCAAWPVRRVQDPPSSPPPAKVNVPDSV